MKSKSHSGESRISSRIDPVLKKKAGAVLAKLGIKQSQAIAMFYAQIVENKGLPFEVKIPNSDTIASMDELQSQKSQKKLTRYSSVKSLMSDLKS